MKAKKLSVLVPAVLFAVQLFLAPQTMVQAQLAGPPVASNQLPDLVVDDIVFETSSPSRIRVRVLNKGNSASGLCYLALMSGHGEDPQINTRQRVWTIQIPALQAGKGYSNVIDVAPLTQKHGPWSALVDRSDKVKEANESNNKRNHIGYGGSVNLPTPDLKITKAELTDATTGEVTVEIANVGVATAQASQLRLTVWEMGQFERKIAKTAFLKVSAIEAHKTTTVKITAGAPIISTRYSLYIDIGNDVTERNEDNNRFEGEAGKS